MDTIGILTLYDALNYGAFLQAFALQNYLEKMGYVVKFIPKNGVSKHPFQKILKYKKGWFKLYGVRTLLKLLSSWESLKLADPSFVPNSIIIGSDEVWSLRNQEFVNLPTYFSLGLNTSRVIAYAPSFGSTKLDDVLQQGYAIEGLKNFFALSARDINTQSIVKAITGNNPPLVLDPTLVSDFEHNDKQKTSGDYIFVYYLGDDRKQIKEIVSYARKTKKRLVSAGIYNLHLWCDDYIVTSPFGFLNLIKNADEVITNTFHGTVLSLKYNKQFCAFAEKRPKVRMILEMLSLGNRDGSSNSVENVLSSTIDYAHPNKIIHSLKEESIAFLRESLR